MGRRRWTIVAGAATVLILCLVSISVIAINRAKHQACDVMARSLWLSLHSYIDAHQGCLPPLYIEDPETGQRHSWRVILLPNVTYDYIYGGYSFQEPWNSPHNRALFRYVPSYVCPTLSRSSELTNYVAVVGENTLWPEPKAPSEYPFAEVGERPTNWPAPRGRKMRRDCWTKIVLVELADSNIPWLEPRDVTLDEFLDAVKRNPQGAFYNKYAKGIQAIDASGNVIVIDPYDDLDKIRNMFLVADDRSEAGTEGESGTAFTVPPAPDSAPSAETAVPKVDGR
jgi:hypothetical protein